MPPTKKKKKQTRNRFEDDIHSQLVKNGCQFEYESEKIPYTIDYNYYPDFIVSSPRGKVYIEAKGYFRIEHKRKMAAVKRLYPDLDIRLLFYRVDRKNIRWAEKYGFKYAFHQIPKDWLEEFQQCRIEK